MAKCFQKVTIVQYWSDNGDIKEWAKGTLVSATQILQVMDGWQYIVEETEDLCFVKKPYNTTPNCCLKKY